MCPTNHGRRRDHTRSRLLAPHKKTLGARRWHNNPTTASTTARLRQSTVVRSTRRRRSEAGWGLSNPCRRSRTVSSDGIILAQLQCCNIITNGNCADETVLRMMLPPAPIAPRATHYCDTLETLRRRIVPGVVLSNNAGRFPDDPTFPLWLGRRIANPRRDRCRSDGTLRPFARATAISWSTMDLVDGIGRPVVSTPTMRPTGSALCVVGRGRSLALCGRPLLENGRPRLVTYLWAVPHEGEPPAARKTHRHTDTHTSHTHHITCPPPCPRYGPET